MGWMVYHSISEANICNHQYCESEWWLLPPFSPKKSECTVLAILQVFEIVK